MPTGLGGAAGQFSAFDLDTTLRSCTNYTSAADVASATGLAVFDFCPRGTVVFTVIAETPGRHQTVRHRTGMEHR